MSRAFVTVLVSGGCLALGAWTSPGQAADPGRTAGPVQVAGQPASDTCVPAQVPGAAQNPDRGVSRTHARPRASSVRPSAGAECQQALQMVRRDAHRAHRNAAIDRSLSQGR